MTREDLLPLLKRAIVDGLHIEDLAADDIADDDALFGGGLDLDSLDAVELAFLVEKEFGVPVPDADAARAAFTSVGGLADFILSRRAEG